ncbi:MAG: phage baseplate upper protein [Alkaliphilus sp.]|nr:phage baseplate upper protein [Alkaliphilus sp.]
MITRQFNVMLDTMNLSPLQSNITVTQNDKDVDTLIIKVKKGEDEIDYEEIDHAKIVFETGNKTVITKDLEKASDRFTCGLETEETSFPGAVLAIVHLYGALGERIATAKFTFTVERDLGGSL